MCKIYCFHFFLHPLTFLHLLILRRFHPGVSCTCNPLLLASCLRKTPHSVWSQQELFVSFSSQFQNHAVSKMQIVKNHQWYLEVTPLPSCVFCVINWKNSFYSCDLMVGGSCL